MDDATYDIFLSHATPDKPWVRTLCDELEARGLRVYLDERNLQPGQNWVFELSEALAKSRYLVLILSSHTDGRPWVLTEWTSYQAKHGPLNRLLPVKIDAVELPTILAATQAVDAIDREPAPVANTLFRIVGDLAKLDPEDQRGLFIGRDWFFSISQEDDQFRSIAPDGTERKVPLPWEMNNKFGLAWFGYQQLIKKAVIEDADRTELNDHSRILGRMLFDLLFDQANAEQLDKACRPGQPRPVVTISSSDDLLLSLPWELIYQKDFLVREQRIDLVRTTPTDVAGEYLLHEPTEAFKLVVNVSAPTGSGLNYEAESYRITLAMAGRCEMTPTELGTLDDLVGTVNQKSPRGIHFSGHGGPGILQFEDDEGEKSNIDIGELADKLRERLPDEKPLPAFFYLASCHGNTLSSPKDNESGSGSSAIHLHRAGITQVVGYFGPIADELSTRAEEALYQAIAEGNTTRYAIRQARQALIRPFSEETTHRPGDFAGVRGGREQFTPNIQPFAWAQLVYYHRGPEFPLSTPADQNTLLSAKGLKRNFEGFGNRRVLSSGFIGRRKELHRIRRKIRENESVFVFQGLGGLGKTTLAIRVLPMLTNEENQVCTIWCQEVEGENDRAAALVDQLLVFCRRRFGLNWEGVVQLVDREAKNSAQRFLYFLQALVVKMPRFVLYFDNLESLLIGPGDDEGDFGQWLSPELKTIWENAARMAEDSSAFYLAASVRYRNPSYNDVLIPVSPLPIDALFRLTEWFPALQKLGVTSRGRLAEVLNGHPRAVEYANDLIKKALARWRDQHGEWTAANRTSRLQNEVEWQELVKPALPQVTEKLSENLLLQTLWDRVLDDPTRRMLYRMTVLQEPAEWRWLLLLGEPDETTEQAEATAERLRDTSLLEQIEVMHKVEGTEGSRYFMRYTLHPATVHFVVTASDVDPSVLVDAHRRLGDFLENEAKDSTDLGVDLAAGHHLFAAGEYNRAYAMLGPASDSLQQIGRAREGLRLLEPFLGKEVLRTLAQEKAGQLLGTMGNAHYHLSEIEKATGYYEQRLVLAREVGDRLKEGSALGNLGNAYFHLGQVEKAIGYHEQKLVITREISDRHGEGSALGNLGNAYLDMGQAEKAIGYFEQRLVISREISDRRGEANGSVVLGIAYTILGQVEEAIDYHWQALVIYQEIGDRQGEGCVFDNLGNSYAKLGQVDKAIDYHEQALVIGREVGDRRGAGSALSGLGSVYFVLGQVEKARGYYEQALKIGKEIRDPRMVESSISQLAKLQR